MSEEYFTQLHCHFKNYKPVLYFTGVSLSKIAQVLVDKQVINKINLNGKKKKHFTK